MKKFILLIAIAAAFASCKKEHSPKCYRCEFFDSNNSGYVRPAETICTDSLPTRFVDKDFNEVAFKCTEK